MLLERYMYRNPGSLLPDGSVVPGGAAVGLNPYVPSVATRALGARTRMSSARSAGCMAADEDDEAYKLRLRRMNNADLTVLAVAHASASVATWPLWRFTRWWPRSYDVMRSS